MSEASFLLNAQLSFPDNPSAHGEGVKLSSPEIQSYGEGIKLSLLPKSTAIPHIEKESKPGVKAILRSSPQILPQNAKLSFPTILQILSILYVGKDLSL